MTSNPYNLEVVTELTMYGAALTERSPPVRRDRRALPWADWCCAFSVFFCPRNGGRGKDHSGVAVSEIVRIKKKESVV